MTSHTRITTPFTRDSTADEVLAGVDLTGRRAVVTGGASGIGVETARALAAAGAEVTLAVRDTEAGERTAAEIARATGNKHVSAAPLELADRASVRAFTEAGTARCTSWSTTPASWPCPSCSVRRRDGSSSSPPTTSGTSG